MKRNDIHRPSVIDPEAYTFVGVEYDRVEDVVGGCQALAAERATIVAHMKATGGTYSNHQHGGNCHVCGAHCIYTVLFYHADTNSYIRTGMDCAEKMHMGDAARFRAIRDAVTAAREAQAGKLKAQGILAEAGLSQAWTIYTHVESVGGRVSDCRDTNTIADIVGKLVRYGSISDAQARFVATLLDRIARRPQIEAERKAEREAAADCPTGRQTIRGEVIKTEVREGAYGDSIKMLVKAAEGFLVWGTVPSNLQLFQVGDYQRGLKRGDRVELVATFTRSDKDSKFGFYKRPIGKLVEAVAAE